MRWKTKSRVVDFTYRGMIMGILNVTPDSFSDGGKYVSVTDAVDHAVRMMQEGAEIIDIGGESTRPGAEPVNAIEEIQRVVPVVEAIRKMSKCLISIDTSKAAVAEAAIKAGADIVNDVTGLKGDVNMAKVCAQHDVGVVVMHMQGEPKTMQQNPSYENVVKEVKQFFEERYRTLTRLGINPLCLCFDPGIGFGKAMEHNLELLRRMKELHVQERPMLLGVSRKRMIGKALNLEVADSRDDGTLAITSLGREKGAVIHRVHAVKRNYEAMRMVEEIINFGE
ncbi:dihydropteroate synthase [Rubritalea halochordaticola]|uniref:Dihydropteroate synthase n=1 Tax=Rubritalea halochordaticola TaxID=714537 RepID=A0ABP9V1I3_9BACT